MSVEQRARQPGFRFTETMGGPVSSVSGDYRRAARAGRRANESLRFILTIQIEDMAAFLDDPEHTAAMTGVVESERFGDRRPVERGVFNLFALDERGRRQMRYRLWFAGADGQQYRLDGFKDVSNNYVLDLWTDTTTLFTRVYTLSGAEQGEEAEASIVATGILHIRPFDLIPQVLSMRAVGARGPWQQARAFGRFGRFFAGQLWAEYGRIGGGARPEGGQTAAPSRTDKAPPE